MPITAKHIESLEEVRLYHNNGHYWPVKFKGDAECAKGFVKFVNEGSVESIDCDCLSEPYRTTTDQERCDTEGRCG